MTSNNISAKLVLLGDMGTGKSSLVLRFVKGQFFDYQESTIGAAFFSQTLALNETTIKLEIWDTAGQERYHSLAPMYYRGAAAAIIVYDLTSLDSFTRAKKWIQELQRQGTPNMVMAIAGNKADLMAKRKVEPEEAQTYANDNGLFFIETSAKTAQNVNELFYEIGYLNVNELLQRQTHSLPMCLNLQLHTTRKATTSSSADAASTRLGSCKRKKRDRKLQFLLLKIRLRSIQILVIVDLM